MIGRVVGWVVKWKNSNGTIEPKAYRNEGDPKGMIHFGIRQIFNTKTRAMDLAKTARWSRGKCGRAVLRVVRYPAKSWDVWCIPDPNNDSDRKPHWYFGYPVTKARAESISVNEYWRAEVRRFKEEPSSEYRQDFVIRSRDPWRYPTARVAWAKVDEMAGGRRKWKVVRAK